MRFKRWQSVALWAISGFILLGLYVVAPDLHRVGWGHYRPGYWIGTFIGAGLVGALIAGAIGLFVTRNSN